MQWGPHKVSDGEKARDEAQMHGIWNHITFLFLRLSPLTFRAVAYMPYSAQHVE